MYAAKKLSEQFQGTNLPEPEPLFAPQKNIWLSNEDKRLALWADRFAVPYWQGIDVTWKRFHENAVSRVISMV